MFKIVNKQILAHDVKRIEIQVESIAKRVKPGQFVIVIPTEDSEWIPLTVVKADPKQGVISLIFQEVGLTTRQLGAIPINDNVYSLIGPLGQPARIEKFGLVICVATGVGIAQILPICQALKSVGNKVIGVMGAKTKRSLILESQMRLTCHKLFISTNDGSFERRGLATDIVKELLDKEKINLIYAIGTIEMLKEVCCLTSLRSIKTLVQLNPIMLCGTGICGSCQLKVKNKIVLACQEGVEFDGHAVDYSDLQIRMNAFKNPLLEDTAKPESYQKEFGPLKRFFLEIFSEK